MQNQVTKIEGIGALGTESLVKRLAIFENLLKSVYTERDRERGLVALV